MTTPDIIGSVRSYRYWMLSGGELKAVAFDYVWHNGLNISQHAGLPPVPGVHASLGAQPDGSGLCPNCGFHSKYQSFTTGNRVPFGVIENEGDIWLHDYGLRSERARIVALQHRKKGVRAALQQNYPSAMIYRSRRKMLYDFPQEGDICGVTTKSEPAWEHPDMPLTMKVYLLLVCAVFVYVTGWFIWHWT